MAKKFHGSYEGLDNRRAQEASDASMIGKGGHANMPQEVIQKIYPKTPSDMPEKIDDTMKGIDSQIKADNSKKKSHMNKEKN